MGNIVRIVLLIYWSTPNALLAPFAITRRDREVP